MKTFIVNTIKRLFLIAIFPLVIISSVLKLVIGPEYNAYRLDEWLAMMKNPYLL